MILYQNYMPGELVLSRSNSNIILLHYEIDLFNFL